MVTGTALINGQSATEGDGISFEQESEIAITDPKEAEIILFDLR